MKIITAHTSRLNNDQLHDVLSALERGDAIIFPTDTVYGIGADATNAEAIKNIFAIKQRDPGQAIAVIVRDIDTIPAIAHTDDIINAILHEYLPGPITFVLASKKTLPSELTGGADSIGVRVINHPVVRQILDAFGKPLAATSANISGQPVASSLLEIKRQFSGKSLQPALVIDGGEMRSGTASSVIAINPDYTLTEIRKGPVDVREIEKHIRHLMKTS
jgi:L-threonylcarbamoyladenylate synthase